MFNNDRKTAAVMAVTGVAGLATFVGLARWGLANKHPVIGIVGGFLLAGSAGAIAGNLTRVVVGQSEGSNMVPLIGGGPMIYNENSRAVQNNPRPGNPGVN